MEKKCLPFNMKTSANRKKRQRIWQDNLLNYRKKNINNQSYLIRIQILAFKPRNNIGKHLSVNSSIQTIFMLEKASKKIH